MTDQLSAGHSQKIEQTALERLRSVHGVIFDMDGTLVLGDRRNHGLKPLPGALELTRWLTGCGIPYVVFTNGSARTPQDYARELRVAGFHVPDENMMTPASCAADLFVRHGYKRVLVFGGEGVTNPLQSAGIEVVPATGKPQVDAVFAGYHREFTMDALEAACYSIWNGARMFSASQTRFFATAEGKSLAPSRAITAMIRDMTGCRVTTVGKPSLDALRCAGRRIGVRPVQLAVVGDDPDLEIAMAMRGNALAVAVNTGLGTPDSYTHLPVTQQPHFILNGVDELLRLWSA